MALSRKTYSKITGLVKNGMSIDMAVELMITLAKTPRDAAESIVEFFTPEKPRRDDEDAES